MPGVQSEEGFEVYRPGDAVRVVDGAQGWELRLEWRLGGLDTSQPVTAVLRVTFDGQASRDHLASAVLQCDGQGPAEFDAGLPLEEQGDAAVRALEGASFTLESVFTDHRPVTADDVVELIVDASGV